jgi:hypothetical protein
MHSFHVSQPDDKVKFLYSIRMRVLQQHIIIPAFSIAQISENILFINVSISWKYKEMRQGIFFSQKQRLIVAHFRGYPPHLTLRLKKK